MTDTPTQTVIGTGDAARILGLSRQQVGRLAATGAIPAQRGPNGIYLYDRADVVALREQRAAKAAA